MLGWDLLIVVLALGMVDPLPKKTHKFRYQKKHYKEVGKSSSSTQKCDGMNLCYPMLLSATEQLESKTEWQ